MNDKLIKQLQNGDERAFEQVYNSTSKAVYYVALSVLKNRNLAEDAMQSTYIKVLQNADKYRAGTNAKAWIVTIAKNEALNMKRKLGRELPFDEQQNPALFGAETTSDYGLLIDVARKTLPEDDFAILMLITACGYKRREVAKIFGKPASTITWKYNNAIAVMRNRLK